jgi:predicted RNA-binding Zn-ribbon protein involved in translation (DUF1610 family)
MGMALIRCVSCRYSFENAGAAAPQRCPQCGDAVTSGESDKPRDARERSKTQELEIIPKPEE